MVQLKSETRSSSCKIQIRRGWPEKTWTGQGRMPKAIAEAVANGRALEEFLI